MSVRILAWGVIGTMALTTEVSAEDMDASAQDVESSSSLDTIIVVGRKREENLQHVPTAMTLVTSELIESTSSTALSDLGKLSPNVDIEGSNRGGGNLQVFIRGVGQTDFIITTDPGVGVYTDGVYVGRTMGANLALLDLESVEILRGPQGTLFGRNTIGGAILINSKRSSDEFEGYAQVTTGRFSRLDARLGLSGPLMNDDVGFRVALQSSNRDGYASGPGGEFGDIDQLAGRVSLDYTPTSDFDARIILDYSKQDQGTIPTETIVIVPSDPVLGLYNGFVGGPSGAPLLPDSIDGDPFAIGGTANNVNDHEIWGASGTLSWGLGGISAKSITAYRELDSEFGRDCDGSEIPYCAVRNSMTQDQFSQELQLSGEGANERLTWTAGIYYYREEATDLSDVQIATGLFDALEALPATLPCLDPATAPPPCASDPFFLTGVAPGGPGNPVNEALNLQIDGFKETNTDAYAVFGQAYFDLNDRVTLETGIRYSEERKDLFFHQVREGVATPFINNVNVSDNYSAVSGRAGISYHVTENVMTYFSAARGFKSGGFNGRATATAAVDPYDPEFLWSYEIGAKTELLQKRLRLNLASFYSDYDDIQLQALVVDVGTGQLLNAIDNAAGAKIFGVEAEAQALITEDFQLDLGLAYLETEYTDIGDAIGITDSSEFPRAPEFTASIGAEYTLLLGAWGQTTLRGDYYYNSGFFQDIVNTEFIEQDAYSLVNLRVRFTNASDTLDLSVFVTNATDEFYFRNGESALGGLGVASINPGRPREWGVSITKRF